MKVIWRSCLSKETTLKTKRNGNSISMKIVPYLISKFATTNLSNNLRTINWVHPFCQNRWPSFPRKVPYSKQRTRDYQSSETCLSLRKSQVQWRQLNHLKNFKRKRKHRYCRKSQRFHLYLIEADETDGDIKADSIHHKILISEDCSIKTQKLWNINV